MAEYLRSCEIDLTRERLEGYEKSGFYDYLNVYALLLARELGHDLPPVHVIRNQGVWRLSFGFALDGEVGGHTRAITALQREEPLQVKQWSENFYDPEDNCEPVFYKPIWEFRERKELIDAV